MNTIEVLGLTKHEFQMLQYDTFLQWANLYASDDDVKTQEFMTNPFIAKWFSIEFEKRLKEFKIAVKPYLNGVFTNTDRLNLLVKVMETIFDIYPSALLTKTLANVKSNKKTIRN